MTAHTPATAPTPSARQRGESSAPPGHPASGPTLRVLACGERARGDDAAGPLAVEAVLAGLPDELRERLDVRDCGGPDPVDMLDQPPGQPCLVVDAVVGVGPGEVVSLPLESVAAGSTQLIPATTHTLSLPETLALAATVRGHPVTGWLVGLGGARFGLGEPLSPDVAAAMPRFEAAIHDAIIRLAHD